MQIAAHPILLHALAMCRGVGSIYATFDSMLLLGHVYFEQGELHQAAKLYQEMPDEIEKTPMDGSTQKLLERISKMVD